MPSLFPQIASSPGILPETQPRQIKFGRSWKFDFAKGDFVQTPTGRVLVLEDTDAWLEWCIKALCTERYKYLIYSRLYGQEYLDMIGESYPREVAESEIKRITVEVLTVDSRTAAVDHFNFTWDQDAVNFSCQIANVLGETRIIGGKVVMY